MSDQHEKKIEDILRMAKEIKPVEANPYLVSKIESKLAGEKPVTKMPLRWTYAIAACIVVVITVNIFIWFNASQAGEKKAIQNLIYENGWGNNDLYSLH